MGNLKDNLKKLWHKLERIGMPQSAFDGDKLNLWRERIVFTILLIAMILGLPAVIPSVLLAIKNGQWIIAVFDLIAYTLVFCLFFFKNIPLKIRTRAITGTILFLGVVLLIFAGPFGAGYIWLFSFSIIVGSLLGFMAALASLVINIFIFFILGIFVSLNALPWTSSVENPLETWIILTLSFVIINIMTTIVTARTLEGLASSLEGEQALSAELTKEGEELMELNQQLESEIAARKITSDSLKQSEQKYKDFLDNAPVGIYTLDYNGNFTYGNRHVLEIIGYELENWLNKPFHPLLHPDDLPKAAEVLIKGRANEKLPPYELRVKTKSGKYIWLELVTEVIISEGEKEIENQISFLSFAQEVTDRREAEEERDEIKSHLQQAQKMEAIGTLAGGIAHDFNNILSGIMGYSELSLLTTKDDSIKSNINQILQAAKRARDLTQQILTFSRRDDQTLGPMAVTPVIKETLKFLRSSVPATLEIVQDLSVENDYVMADPTQMHQIIMNLCTNASQAMGTHTGELKVSVQDVDILPADISNYQKLKPGPHLKLTVSDNGPGIPDEIISRIFEPYFTTKKPGEGTGMGLSVVYGIVRNWGGEILVKNGLDKGTSFHIFLPKVFPGFKENITQEEKDIPGGTECILFVDDEKPLTDFGRKLLEHLGYEVLCCNTSIEALEIFRADHKKFDLILTDQTMPNMTGMDMAQEMLLIRPDLPIILMTGFSQEATEEKVAQVGIKSLLLKPMNIRETANALRKALD